MAIENNLPIIFDTATQTEDGLMSFNDKIKLDNMEETLTDKLSKSDKIKSSQLDISSDEVKIQPENLSDAVKAMMTGTTPVSSSVPNNGVTTEKIATNAVTTDKIDKRVLLGNVVSVRPLNFAFDTKKVSINIPQGSLFLTDATTKRILVTDSDTKDVIVNINYPAEFDGLNFIVSNPAGTLSMINYRKLDTITNTTSVMALVSLSKTYEVSIVMNGNYTINGLAQGVGTESAALLGDGKIIFEESTGVIDFSDTTVLTLLVGGVFKRTIESQSSIRLTDYTKETTYVLYWDNATSSLKTSLATVSNSDTDIYKIALISNGRIIPFVDTGIYYSKPNMESPYYTNSVDYIQNITVSGESKIDITNINDYKIIIPDQTYVCLKDTALLVKNKQATYDGRNGIYFILFNLDTQNISCVRANDNMVTTTVSDIVLATFSVKEDKIIVSGNLDCTVNGKTPYEDDLSDAKNSIKALQNMIDTNITKDTILAGDTIYMVAEEELPVYQSSMLINNAEGIKTAISYNKKNDIMSPRVEFFDGNTLLDNNKGDKVSLLAYDKYNTNAYLKKEVAIKKVPSTYKSDASIKILCLGDELLKDKTALYVKNKLTSFGTKPELIGTMTTNGIYCEGREGWFYSTFVGASGRGIKEGKITPQVSKGASTELLNPFIRVANADDKANKPNDCYRATGAYTEKTYYNDSDKNGTFYIFDFAKYMEVQGIAEPDVVVIAIKPEMVDVFTEDIVSTNMLYMKQLINGIRTALPNAYIALIPQYGACTVYDDKWNVTSKMISETIKFVDGLEDEKIKVLSAWLHMNRELGTEFDQNKLNTQLYAVNSSNIKLSEIATIELANAISAFIMNI